MATSMATSDLFEWPSETSVGRGLRSLEETLLCPICSEFMDNAHSLPCGHTYCSMCIRKHFDRKLNVVSYDQCPSCREKSEMALLKCNKQLQSVIIAFIAVRSDLLTIVKKPVPPLIVNSGPADVQTKRNTLNAATDVAGDEPQRIVLKDFHKWSKEKVKKEITAMCSRSRVGGSVYFLVDLLRCQS
jgi:hypothetical protein